MKTVYVLRDISDGEYLGSSENNFTENLRGAKFFETPQSAHRFCGHQIGSELWFGSRRMRVEPFSLSETVYRLVGFRRVLWVGFWLVAKIAWQGAIIVGMVYAVVSLIKWCWIHS